MADRSENHLDHGFHTQYLEQWGWFPIPKYHRRLQLGVSGHHHGLFIEQQQGHTLVEAADSLWRDIPARIRVDNGPELIANDLQEWTLEMG